MTIPPETCACGFRLKRFDSDSQRIECVNCYQTWFEFEETE